MALIIAGVFVFPAFGIAQSCSTARYTVHFFGQSSRLDDEDEGKIANIASNVTRCSGAYKAVILGHTEATEDDHLANARAALVRIMLSHAGIPDRNLASYGRPGEPSSGGGYRTAEIELEPIGQEPAPSEPDVASDISSPVPGTDGNLKPTHQGVAKTASLRAPSSKAPSKTMPVSSPADPAIRPRADKEDRLERVRADRAKAEKPRSMAQAPEKAPSEGRDASRCVETTTRSRREYTGQMTGFGPAYDTVYDTSITNTCHYAVDVELINGGFLGTTAHATIAPDETYTASDVGVGKVRRAVQ